MMVWVLIAAFALLLSSCGPSDESGTIGTGVMLRGTVSEQTRLASNEIEIKAQSGAIFNSEIAGDGRYAAEEVAGVGPWLLRINLGNNEHLYGVAYEAGVSNVHGYSDVAIRRWFLEQHAITDLDLEFEADGALQALPTQTELASLADEYFAIIGFVLDDYGLQGSQLLNSEFRADNTGIDRFLKLNPVIVEGREVTIVTRAPDSTVVSNTQVATVVDLLLGNDQNQEDVDPPTAPENLRALVSSATETVLVWDPSTDNTAVIGYDIRKDGVLIAISPYPVYVDSEVEAGVASNYEVAAIDTVGNRSMPSLASTDGLASPPDTTVPDAPMSLEFLRATTRLVELSWLHNRISSVASFNVYRGQTPDNTSLLLTVGNTELIDATISSGQQFCYQISAVSATGTESELTDALCVTTTGIAVTTPVQPLITVPPLAGLTIPATESLSCSTVFPQYNIDDLISLEQGCYLVEQDIIVDNFGRLTLNPGVVLKFSAGTELRVRPNGGLISQGTNESPVVMTGESSRIGFWRGVWINRSDDASNLISHTVIEYAGSESSTSGLTLESSTNAPVVIGVENSLIRFSGSYGISIPGLDADITSFQGNLITQNDRAAFVNYSSLSSVIGSSEFSDNTLNRLFVSLGNYDREVVIDDPGLPLQLSGINQLSGTIIINEGVEMFFTNNTSFIVRENLAINGTAERPVLISSINLVPGNWQGVQLIEGANVNLNNVIIEYGGLAGGMNPEGSNLFANDARLSVNNLTLRNSSSFGFYATGDQVIVDSAEQVSIVDNARQDILELSDFVLQ